MIGEFEAWDYGLGEPKERRKRIKVSQSICFTYV